MADGKWIQDLAATTPLANAARHVLTIRLEVVRDYLPKAVHEWEKDSEHVHQLRVGTRRARAALDIFAGCLPLKDYKAARKRLRGVRRGAGEARDWDVFLAGLARLEPARATQPKGKPAKAIANGNVENGEFSLRLSSSAVKKARPGFDFLIGYALAQRLVAQSHLQEAAGDYPFSFDRVVADTVAAVVKPNHPQLRTLADLARPSLAELLGRFSEAAAEDLEDYVHLHQVRILGKRLRYAMEVFADCFVPAFREQYYPAIEEMQTILGNANDSYVASSRLSIIIDKLRSLVPKELKRFRPGVEALLRFHRERLPHERQRFLRWWERWQQSGHAASFAALVASQ